jgi:prepilin-type N-terminal cleavage/methylation domain-containing protein
MALVTKMRTKAFTLAELLIAVAILGEIATFTIPKIVSAQQKGTYAAAAKENIAAVSAAYRQYALNNTVSASTKFADMTPYLNYVRVDTTGSLDWIYGNTTVYNCSSSSPCLRMHNGSTIQYWDFENYGGTSTTHGFLLLMEPDGVVSGSTATGPGKGLAIVLFYNGRISDVSQTGVSCCNTYGWPSGVIPPWFSW